MLTVDLQHDFPDLALNASFQVPPGITALFGPSGAGKTTIVNAIAGLMRPDHCRITLDDTVLTDTDARQFLPPYRRRIGYVFQEARLFPHLSVRQNLLYGRRFCRQQGADPALIIEMLGIGRLLDRRPGTLSGGERQRVSLGRAILSNPLLLLMDEPLAALDQARKDEILPYLERMRDETRLPILYVSHAPAEIARLANQIVLLKSGRVVAAGRAAEILSDPAMAPVLGAREAGAILNALIEAQDPDGLTRLATAAGPIWLSQIEGAPGQLLRLRILAQDVMIAQERPTGISALNILPVMILDRTETEDGVLMRLDARGEKLLARITRRSAENLSLTPGRQVHAVLKAIAIAPDRIGAGGTRSTGLGIRQ